MTAPNLSSVRREPLSRKRPSSTAAMKISTIAAATSIADVEAAVAERGVELRRDVERAA